MRKDTGYSWVVLASAFMLNVHQGGGVGSVGIFLVEFMDHFEARKSATTLIAALFLCTGFLFGLPVGWLCRTFGCRPVALGAGLLVTSSYILSACAPNITTLYFTYGCLASIALCTFFNTGTIAIQQYFDRRRAMASGVSIAGTSLGVFLWSPFTRWSVDHYGWRGALLLQAGVHLHSLIFACLLRPPPASEKGQVSAQFSSLDTEKAAAGKLSRSAGSEGCANWSGYMRTQLRVMTSPLGPSFCGYLCGVLLVQAGHIVPYGLLPTRAKVLGIDKTLGATLVSIIGAVSGGSRAVIGVIGDRPCVDRVVLSGVSGAAAGTLTALSSLLTDYPQLAVYTVLLGIASAPYIGLQGASVVDLVGSGQNLATGIGYLSFAIGLGHLLGLTISGKLLDIFPDPAITFLTFGGLEFLGGIIIIITVVIKKICTPKKKLTELQRT